MLLGVGEGKQEFLFFFLTSFWPPLGRDSQRFTGDQNWKPRPQRGDSEGLLPALHALLGRQPQPSL